MNVTQIEVHQITLPFKDWLAYPLSHYASPSQRTIYVAHTDTGLIGLGDGGRRVDDDVLDRYIGSNPFDWMGDELSLPLGMAMYDLMGQAAGVPVYKLFGQKHRSWVPVGSWTVSTHPDHMAEAVQRYASMGYTWMKYHLSPFENVLDQTEAMQAVAPPGFRVHYDFTGGGTDDHMVNLLLRLQEYPIAGCFEDAIDEKDIEGSIDLCKRIRLPIVRHRAALDCTYEVMMGAGDAYIRGHQLIGPVARQAGLFHAGEHPLHDTERGHDDFPRDDDSHDGRLPIGQLSLLLRYGNVDRRRRARTARSGQWLRASARKARAGIESGSAGSRAPGGVGDADDAPMDYRFKVRQWDADVLPHGSGLFRSFHGAPRLETRARAIQLLRTDHNELLGRRRRQRIRHDVCPIGARRHGAGVYGMRRLTGAVMSCRIPVMSAPQLPAPVSRAALEQHGQ